ncbi:hypothetical protein CYMTET_56479 [Cymbomonas tetramitiformis]|uniref:GPS domain-containing protein n=1 Tax=Cymbomonas tetramitiformis TaxID=36881 RepID=A0AAE0ELX5_9CHLO|nr:hypothetical protein CYMTET_56479 [Cymbomonas tetramitiformis]
MLQAAHKFGTWRTRDMLPPSSALSIYPRLKTSFPIWFFSLLCSLFFDVAISQGNANEYCTSYDFSDAIFATEFEIDFISQMAAAAKVNISAVTILSIVAGSVQVSSEAAFTSADAATAFLSLLQDAPSDIFTFASFRTFGTPTTTNLIVELDSAPPPSPPPPPPFPSEGQGPCPAGYHGSGDTMCIRSISCDVDNGGCDPLTLCSTDSGGTVLCGECPVGYDGAGATGCVDLDGCDDAECYPGVACGDVLAPGTGHTCGPCPAGTFGDGAECQASVCWEANGGCDLRVTCEEAPGTAAGRTCAPCPAGYEDALQDGSLCVNADACMAMPCYPGVGCVDVPVPGTGYTCGACPAGMDGDGETCEDVDECAAESNGGCWALGAVDPEVRTDCVNAVGGSTCTACPEGFLGSGETECRPVAVCTEDNGGCDLHSNCTDAAAGPLCGPCGAGYSGSGATGCADTDGCALKPCFDDGRSAAWCSDVAAPGVGHVCGPCPEGYKGDGRLCELCTLDVAITATSVVNGQVFRAQTVQVGGRLGEMDAGCTNTLGTSFQWMAASVPAENLELSDDINKANTLTLALPPGSLEVLAKYTFKLEAWLAGDPRVRAEAAIEAYVAPQPLQALVAGGGGVVGEGTLLELDGSVSVDPDDAPGVMTYAWRCRRHGGGEGTWCRDSSGARLPMQLSNATLRLHMQGSTEGLNYTFELTVVKGERTDSTVVAVTVIQGEPPAPAISPIVGKVNPSIKLALPSTVSSVREGSVVALDWALAAASNTTPSLDLLSPDVLLSESIHGTILVLQPNSLAPLGRYLVTLTATVEDGAYGSASLLLVVNQEPQGGHLHVSPLEGVALETSFVLATAAWEDDDLPLEYLFTYTVIGETGHVSSSTSTASGEEVVLALYGPATTLQMALPEAGAEEADFMAEVLVYARDVYGAVGGPRACNLTVRGLGLQSEEQVVAYSKGVLHDASVSLLNGAVDAAVNSVAGASRLLGEPATSARMDDAELEEEEEVETERRAQREEMVVLTRDANSMLVATAEAQERMASLVANIVDCPPTELSRVSRDTALEVMDAVVTSALMDPSTGVSKLTASAGAQVLAGLSSLTAQGEDAARAHRILQATADAFLQTLASGELPTQVLSEGMQLTTQRDTLGGTGSTYERLFGEVLAAAPEGPAVRFPTELRERLVDLGHTMVEFRLLSTQADPHAYTPYNTSNITVAADETDLTGGSIWDSPVVTVTLSNECREIGIANLSEPIALNITLETWTDVEADVSRNPEDLPLMCSFWDEAAGLYSTTGCATIPNPAPRGAQLYWRDDVWEKIRVREGEEEALLAASWGLSHGLLLHDCNEEYVTLTHTRGGAQGADNSTARKYTGTACELPDPGNEEGCWWNWSSAGFMGAGCELSPVLQCRCTHLSDYRAIQSPGTFDSTFTVELISEEELILFDPAEDFAKNTELLVLLGVMAGVTVMLTVASNVDDEHQRRRYLEHFMKPYGTGKYWCQKEPSGLYTWSLFEEEVHTRVKVEWKETSAQIKRKKLSRANSMLSSMTRKLSDLLTPPASPLPAASKDQIAPLPKGPLETKAPAAGVQGSARWPAHSLHHAAGDDIRDQDFPNPVFEEKRADLVHSSREVSSMRTIIERSRTEFLLKTRHADNSFCDVKPEAEGLDRILLSPVNKSLGRSAARTPARPWRVVAPYDMLACHPLRPSMSTGKTGASELSRDATMTALAEIFTGAKPGQRQPKSEAASDRPVATRSYDIHQQISMQALQLCSFQDTKGRSAQQLWAILREAYTRRTEMDSASSRHLCHLCALRLVPLRMSLPLEYLRRVSSSTSGVGLMSALDPLMNALDSGLADQGAKALPLERLLGTALVLAVMSTMRLLPEKELDRQLALARSQHWRHPPGRGFNWFLKVFQLMVARNLGARGWHQHATLWNLVLLQNVDGSLIPDGAGDLASALHAGEPWESPVSSLHSRFPDTAMLDSVPAELLEALGYAPSARPELHSLALRVWATILAVARYHTLSFAWCVNPKAPPGKRSYFCDTANAWLEGEAQERPALKEQLGTLRERGQEVVAHWAEEQRKRLLLAKSTRIPPDHRLERPRLRRRLYLLAEQLVQTAIGHHMVLGLQGVQFWDPVSRGARLALLSTNWILMIFIAVGIYYSRAMLCCRELKEHLGCDSLSTESACTVAHPDGRNVTYATCGALLTEADDFDDFSCQAFPQSTLADSFIMVMYMCALVIPIRLLLTVLFGLQHGRSVPEHWVVSPRAVKSAFGGHVAGIIQAMVYVKYALLINIDKLKKAFIALFMIAITVVLKPAQRISGAIRRAQRCGRAVTAACRRAEECVAKSTGGLGVLLLPPLTAPGRCLLKLVFDHSANAVTYGLIIALWLAVAYVDEGKVVGGKLVGPAMGPVVAGVEGGSSGESPRVSLHSTQDTIGDEREESGQVVVGLERWRESHVGPALEVGTRTEVFLPRQAQLEHEAWFPEVEGSGGWIVCDADSPPGGEVLCLERGAWEAGQQAVHLREVMAHASAVDHESGWGSAADWRGSPVPGGAVGSRKPGGFDGAPLVGPRRGQVEVQVRGAGARQGTGGQEADEQVEAVWSWLRGLNLERRAVSDYPSVMVPK